MRLVSIFEENYGRFESRLEVTATWKMTSAISKPMILSS